MKPKLVLMTGYPTSLRGLVARELEAAGFAYIGTEVLREESGYYFDPHFMDHDGSVDRLFTARERQLYRRIHNLKMAYLGQEKNVVVDCGSPEERTRRALLLTDQWGDDPGVECERYVVYVEADWGSYSGFSSPVKAGRWFEKVWQTPSENGQYKLITIYANDTEFSHLLPELDLIIETL